MWPQGFNSAYPGRPASAWVKRIWRTPDPTRTEIKDDEVDEVGRQVSTWLRRLQNEGGDALNELKKWDKAKLRETLDWIQVNVPAHERRANLIAVETTLIEELKERRAHPLKRQFLKLSFSNQEASALLLANVLRSPEVYSKHPEPEAAAAIMVVNKFRPQIQALLCNYAAAARELNLSEALQDELQDCECRNALFKPDDTMMHEGHVLTIETRNLRWPYLRSIAQRGKKFRLESDIDTVFVDLRHSLDSYVAWCSHGDERRLPKLEEWAEAVYQRCRSNWERKMTDPGSHFRGPKGFPALRRTILEAQRVLVFLLDDRAPHGLVVVCKRWYQKEMAKYLSDNTVFEEANISWSNVTEIAEKFNQDWGFPNGKGIVYNYGIWKPTKRRFRFIAGTRTMSREEGAPDRQKSSGPPRQPLYEAHKALVKILQHVEKTLKEIDKIRQSQEGIRAMWGIDSISAFTRLVRTHSDIVLKEGQFTADFCTMYTSFTFEHVIQRTLQAIDEAWTFGSRNNPSIQTGEQSLQLTLGTQCWPWCDEGHTRQQVREFPELPNLEQLYLQWRSGAAPD